MPVQSNGSCCERKPRARLCRNAREIARRDAKMILARTRGMAAGGSGPRRGGSLSFFRGVVTVAVGGALSDAAPHMRTVGTSSAVRGRNLEQQISLPSNSSCSWDGRLPHPPSSAEKAVSVRRGSPAATAEAKSNTGGRSPSLSSSSSEKDGRRVANRPDRRSSRTAYRKWLFRCGATAGPDFLAEIKRVATVVSQSDLSALGFAYSFDLVKQTPTVSVETLRVRSLLTSAVGIELMGHLKRGRFPPRPGLFMEHAAYMMRGNCVSWAGLVDEIRDAVNGVGRNATRKAGCTLDDNPDSGGSAGGVSDSRSDLSTSKCSGIDCRSELSASVYGGRDIQETLGVLFQNIFMVALEAIVGARAIEEALQVIIAECARDAEEMANYMQMVTKLFTLQECCAAVVALASAPFSEKMLLVSTVGGAANQASPTKKEAYFWPKKMFINLAHMLKRRISVINCDTASIRNVFSTNLEKMQYTNWLKVPPYKFPLKEDVAPRNVVDHTYALDWRLAQRSTQETRSM